MQNVDTKYHRSAVVINIVARDSDVAISTTVIIVSRTISLLISPISNTVNTNIPDTVVEMLVFQWLLGVVVF